MMIHLQSIKRFLDIIYFILNTVVSLSPPAQTSPFPDDDVRRKMKPHGDDIPKPS